MSDFDRGTYWLDRALSEAHVGSRDHRMMWLACQLRDNRIPRAESEGIARAYAQAVDMPSNRYTEREALSTLRSVFKDQPREAVGGEPSEEERRQYAAIRRSQERVDQLVKDLAKDIKWNRNVSAFDEEATRREVAHDMGESPHWYLWEMPNEILVRRLREGYEQNNDELFNKASQVIASRMITLSRIARNYYKRHRRSLDAFLRDEVEQVPEDLFEQIGIDYDTI